MWHTASETCSVRENLIEIAFSNQQRTRWNRIFRTQPPLGISWYPRESTKFIVSKICFAYLELKGLGYLKVAKSSVYYHDRYIIFTAKMGIYSNLWVWLTILTALVLFVSMVTDRQQDFDDHRQIDVHIKYIKVHTATMWTIKHGLMLLWFADLMNVTEEVTIHRPNVSTLLSSAFIRGDLNAATRGPLYDH